MQVIVHKDCRSVRLLLAEKQLKNNGKTIEGSCAALSELGTLAIDGYDGISECKDITCSNIEPAVCKDGGREVDCALFKEEGFLSS